MKLKILWVCDIVLPDFACEFGIKRNPYGGWTTGLLHQLINRSEIQIALCFPVHDIRRLKDGILGSNMYYSFHCKNFTSILNNKTTERFMEILLNFKPDVVHIWGAENPHSFEMLRACENLSMINKVVVNIQGLVSICAKHYFSGIPNKYLDLKIGRNNTIEDDMNEFLERGKHESLLLKKVPYIIGRTDWDRACTFRINPYNTYYFCNEILRDMFYEHIGEWDINKCKRHSIFISQANYPIKGFHYVLRALPDIIKFYPDTHINVSGHSPLTETKNGLSPYGIFIKDLICELDLENQITFLGQLDEELMIKEYLNAHVFISASTVENESNSISEAKLLGTPVISSFVGGATNRVNHRIDGLLYPYDAPYMLAYYSRAIFENDKMSNDFSKNAVLNITEVVNKEMNSNRIVDIYNEINYKAKNASSKV